MKIRSFDSIIDSVNFNGVILEMEDYEPEEIIDYEPYTKEYPLYDSCLMLLDSSLNLYVFHPENYYKALKKIMKIREKIKKIHKRPIDLTHDEVGTKIFTYYMLLGVSPDEVYNSIFPPVFKIDKKLFEILYTQSARINIITASSTSKSLYIKNPRTYSFLLHGLSLEHYVIYEVIPFISKLIQSNYGYQFSILNEGSHVMYPIIKIDDNFLKAEITTYSMLEPKKIETHSISMTLPVKITIKPIESMFSRTHIGFAGYTVYIIASHDNSILQVDYNILTGKGRKVFLKEDYSFTEKVHSLEVREKEIIIDDIELKNYKIIETPQYILQHEKYYSKIIPEEVIEKAKNKKDSIDEMMNYYPTSTIYYNEIFKVIII